VDNLETSGKRVVRRKAIALIGSDLRRKKNTKQSGKKKQKSEEINVFRMVLGWFSGPKPSETNVEFEGLRQGTFSFVVLLRSSVCLKYPH